MNLKIDNAYKFIKKLDMIPQTTTKIIVFFNVSSAPSSFEAKRRNRPINNTIIHKVAISKLKKDLSKC